jgi:O-antigen/teichoic acid export membrane protein
MDIPVSALEPPFEEVAEIEFAAPADEVARSRLLRGSAWLSVSTVITALGGLLFWVVAARVATSREVGQATALFSAILFVNYLTNMGLVIAIARYARDDSPASTLTYWWGLIITGATSAIAAVAFFWLAPSRTVAPLRAMDTSAAVVVFAAIAAGVALTTLLDARLLALRRWSWVFVRALAVMVVRIVLVAYQPLHDRGLWIFLVAAGVPAISGAVGVAFVEHGRWRRARIWPLPRATIHALRYAAANYVPVLAEQAPLLVLPVIVLVTVGSAENANFYVAWGATLFTLMIPTAIAQVLLVEGGRDGGSLDHQTKIALFWSLTLMTVAWLVVWVGKSLITTVYGNDYLGAAAILPELVAAGISWSIMSIAITRARIEHATRSALVLTSVFAVTVLVPAAFWTSTSGILGAAHAWIIGCLVAGCMGAVFLASRMPPIADS